MFVTGNFKRGDRVKLINDETYQDQYGRFLAWDNGLAQVALENGTYWFEAHAIEYVKHMFNVGDNVTVSATCVKAYGLPSDKGIIYSIHDDIVPSGRVSYIVTVANEQYHILENELLTAVLTIPEIQQLKEQLALDLLALIEIYEKRTNTYIADIHLITTVFYSTPRVTGVRLEIRL
jgi:hypothetical protein